MPTNGNGFKVSIPTLVDHMGHGSPSRLIETSASPIELMVHMRFPPILSKTPASKPTDKRALLFFVRNSATLTSVRSDLTFGGSCRLCSCDTVVNSHLLYWTELMSHMVIAGGVEPSVIAVKGLCPTIRRGDHIMMADEKTLRTVRNCGVICLICLLERGMPYAQVEPVV